MDPQRRLVFLCALMGRRKATIADAGICDNPSELAGDINFQIPLYESRSRGNPHMLAKVRELRTSESLAHRVRVAVKQLLAWPLTPCCSSPIAGLP